MEDTLFVVNREEQWRRAWSLILHQTGHVKSKTHLVRRQFHFHFSLLQHHQDSLLQHPSLPMLLHRLLHINLAFLVQQTPTINTHHQSPIPTTYLNTSARAENSRTELQPSLFFVSRKKQVVKEAYYYLIKKRKKHLY